VCRIECGDRCLRERAERRLAGRTDEEVDYVRALAALARALTRILTSGRAG